jgi:hypothetical protein
MRVDYDREADKIEGSDLMFGDPFVIEHSFTITRKKEMGNFYGI